MISEIELTELLVYLTKTLRRVKKSKAALERNLKDYGEGHDFYVGYAGALKLYIKRLKEYREK